MVLNYYSPLRLIRGLAPGNARARRRPHHQRRRPGACFSEASPLFGVYNASKAALSAVSRVIETEWGRQGRALDDAVLPTGGHADDRADQGLRRDARADARKRPPSG